MIHVLPGVLYRHVFFSRRRTRRGHQTRGIEKSKLCGPDVLELHDPLWICTSAVLVISTARLFFNEAVKEYHGNMKGVR